MLLFLFELYMNILLMDIGDFNKWWLHSFKKTTCLYMLTMLFSHVESNFHMDAWYVMFYKRVSKLKLNILRDKLESMVKKGV